MRSNQLTKWVSRLAEFHTVATGSLERKDLFLKAQVECLERRRSRVIACNCFFLHVEGMSCFSDFQCSSCCRMELTSCPNGWHNTLKRRRPAL